MVTLSYVFVTPPFQVPDETQHFYHAYQFSIGRWLPTPGTGAMGEITMGAVLPRSIRDLTESDFALERIRTYRRYTWDDIRHGFNRPLNPAEETFVPFANVASYAPTLYAPQALGIVIGRFAGLPPLGLLYLARLLNAATGVALVLSAIALAPFGSRIFLAVAALPTTSYQMASASPDATIIGISFLAISLSIRACSSVGPRGWSSSAIIPTGILLGLAKGIYLPLLFAGLKSPRLGNRELWTTLCCAALGAFGFGVWMAYSGGTVVPFHVVSRKTNEIELTATVNAQLSVLWSDPFAYAYVLITSFRERLPVYLLQIVGRFGWNAILMPLVVYVIAAMTFLFSLLAPMIEATDIGAVRRVWWLSIVGINILLVETALYLTGTPLRADYIQGTQGRYFLPVLPLFGLALLIPVRQSLWLRAFPVLAILLTGAGLSVALYSFWIAGYVKYTGLPPISWTAAGLTRLFFLPSGSW